jgi:hypothetical protein
MAERGVEPFLEGYESSVLTTSHRLNCLPALNNKGFVQCLFFTRSNGIPIYPHKPFKKPKHLTIPAKY